MNNKLIRLISIANKASANTRWGYYPMSPSIGLSEREIARHEKAMEAHGNAYKALIDAGLKEEAIRHERARYNHELVVSRVGNY